MTAHGRGFDSEGGDREVGRFVEETYATRVGLDAAARHLWAVDREARRLRRRRRHQRLVSAAASLLLLITAAGAVAGSATALPGETLYPVKEGLERAELTMAVSDDAHARAHVRHSRARLEELREAAESNPEVVPELAERFFESLDRAVAVGGPSVAGQVAALRSIGAAELNTIMADLDSSIAESLAASEAVSDWLAAADDGEADAQATSSASGSGGAGASGGDAAEPLDSGPPETAVAEVGDEDGGDDEAGSEQVDGPEESGAEESGEETETVEVPRETIVADPAAEERPETSTVETPPETGTAETDEGAESEGDGEPSREEEPAEEPGGSSEPGGDEAADGADGSEPEDGGDDAPEGGDGAPEGEDGGDKRPDRDELEDMMQGEHRGD
jgi:hypothetical protein